MEPGGTHNKNIDTLGTYSYAKALAGFIKDCNTPMTIGVQGEWGSGKTSLLNMISEEIKEQEVSMGKGRPKGLGKQKYDIIWINTWEHSLLKSPEECLLSIISEIIDVVSEHQDSYNSKQKARAALSQLARGAVRIGATAALGAKGGQVADDLLGEESSGNSISELRKTLGVIFKSLIESKDQDFERFIIFVDDLDRLEPSTAVKVLELLKNIFSLEHCVFVLAIDYQVIVKGLRVKFGEQDEKNEWEYRAFFDKIIQLPFMMPMAHYDLHNYIVNLLADTDFLSKSEANKLINADYFTELTLRTVGSNPRSIKRLVNSLSLIRRYADFEEDNKQLLVQNEYILKQLLYSLVCIQISFPKIFELLISEPLFFQWDDDFSNKITGGRHEENKELTKALSAAMEIHEEEFDEDWEQVLFKIVWVKEWQRNKVLEVSKVLNLIKEKILHRSGSDEETQKKLIKNALTLTAVTAVASTEDSVFSKSQSSNSEGDMIGQHIRFWQIFKQKTNAVNTCLNSKITSTFSSAVLGRKHEEIMPERIIFKASIKSSSISRVESHGDDMQENFALFTWFRSYAKELESEIGVKPRFKISDDSSRQSITFSPPPNVPGRLDLSKPENEHHRDVSLTWFCEVQPKIETIIKRATIEFEAQSEINSPVPDSVTVPSRDEQIDERLTSAPMEETSRIAD
ncbi:MAG: P-loop NTPase fold protein [Rhodospirillaceae bacterium]